MAAQMSTTKARSDEAYKAAELIARSIFHERYVQSLEDKSVKKMTQEQLVVLTQSARSKEAIAELTKRKAAQDKEAAAKAKK